MAKLNLSKLQEESKARHLSRFQAIQNSSYFINDPDDDSRAQRYLKRIYRTSSSLEEIKKKLALRINLKYSFFDESILPENQPEIIEAKNNITTNGIVVANNSKDNFFTVQQKGNPDWRKIYFNNTPVVIKVPADKKESLAIQKKNKVDMKKIKKFAEESPKKFERPKAVYSNTSPYGIAAELRKKE